MFSPVITNDYWGGGWVSEYLAYFEDGTGFSEEKKTSWIVSFAQLFLNFLWNLYLSRMEKQR